MDYLEMFLLNKHLFAGNNFDDQLDSIVVKASCQFDVKFDGTGFDSRWGQKKTLSSRG